MQNTYFYTVREIKGILAKGERYFNEKNSIYPGYEKDYHYYCHIKSNIKCNEKSIRYLLSQKYINELALHIAIENLMYYTFKISELLDRLLSNS